MLTPFPILESKRLTFLIKELSLLMHGPAKLYINISTYREPGTASELLSSYIEPVWKAKALVIIIISIWGGRRSDMAQVDNRGRDGRWSLEGTTALVTGGTKGIGFFFLSALITYSY
jgi:hypothetical protein